MHRCATRGKLALLLILNTGILFLSSCGLEQPLPTLVVALSTLPASPRVDPTIQATGRSLPATITVTPDQTAFPTDVVSPATEPVITASATLIIPSRTPTASPTATPTATATRYVSVIGNLPPTDELGPSKLGLHVVRNNDPNILEFVRKAQPAVMKAVDDLGFLAEVKAVSPRTITIGRHSVGGTLKRQPRNMWKSILIFSGRTRPWTIGKAGTSPIQTLII